jgi:carbon-monoxide dehydrogenase large subunit
MSYRFIGKSLSRTEDLRLIQGLGRYTGDLVPPGHVRLHVLRSPYAAARIRGFDTKAAEQSPGVHLVLTGHDPRILALGPMPSKVKRQTPDGQPNFEPPYRALSAQAQFVGDGVAAVFADTLDQAKDAAEKIEIDWEPLPAVTDAARAAEPGMPQVWEQAPGNICFVFEAGNRVAVAAAMEQAAHKVSLDFRVNRITAVPMEGRVAIGSYDPAEDLYTLQCGVQNPHAVRADLADAVLKIPGNKVRVIAPDVGGAFGLKESPFAEYVLTLIGAKIIGRPVFWMAERSESFTCDYHARDNVSRVTLGLDTDGTFVALDIETVANIGAYIATMGLHSPTNNLGGLSGVYRTPHIHAKVIGVFSNTPPTAPYRGAGRPEATYAIERVIDVAAQRLGFDRVELRRRNMIAPDQMPYQTGFVFTYDSGEFEKNMDIALAATRFADFPKRRNEALKRGKLAGISVVNAIEISAGPVGAPLTESAEIRFDTTGSVTVTLGLPSHGQGHEVTFKQIVADILGLSLDDISVRYGDTDRIEHGTGTFGSRSVIAGSVSLIKSADRLIARGKKIAAVHFEADPGDIVFDNGEFSVAGTDKRVTLKDIARLSYTLRDESLGGEFGLAEKVIAAPSAPTFPNGCHVCEVEIDPETGGCSIVQYCVVDDVGRIVNPKLVKGQIHGGVAQGVGQVLRENISYDADGQLLTGSFMDYGMPRASDFPDIICESNEVPTPTNPLGVKGAGEAGTVGALPAVVNAIVNALAPYGIEHIDMPITSEKIWRAIHESQRRAVKDQG